MSLLEVLQLIGYSTAAALHLWIGALLVRRRRVLGRLERVLMALALTLGVWHTSNLLVALHAMLGLSDRWTVWLRLADTLAVVSITLTYSMLLHVHLHLWANARRRGLTSSERARVYLSYTPALFLLYAAPKLWTGAYAPMFVRLSHLLLPFALWAGYVLCPVALWLTARYGLRPGAVEGLLILMLALVAAPLRRWLDKRFRRLFEQEAGLFRDVVARIGESAGRYGQLPELLRFVEARAAENLGLRRVRLRAFAPASDNAGGDEKPLPSGDRENGRARGEVRAAAGPRIGSGVG